jgi:serine/threonine protein phosphatase 1
LSEQHAAPDIQALKPAAFAALPAGRRTWAVASIHGEAERLAVLHDRLAVRIAPADNLVYLGNLLGRGPAVAATMHELLVFRRAVLARHIVPGSGEIVFLRGSQEEMWHKLLQMQFAANPPQVFEWLVSRGVGASIEAYQGSIEDGRTAARRGAVALSRWTNGLRAAVRARDGHERLLSGLKRAAYTADEKLLFVSTGVDPGRPLAQQTDVFWWGNARFEAAPHAFPPFRRVVRGFDPQHRGVQVSAFITSLDGGCGFGGPLVAGCFDADGQLTDCIEA